VLAQGGTHLIVGGLLSRSLTSFSREPFTGALTEAGNLNLPAGPEKLSIDGQGELLVGAHANLLDWRAFTADPHRRAPSQIFRVSHANDAQTFLKPHHDHPRARRAGEGAARRLLCFPGAIRTMPCVAAASPLESAPERIGRQGVGDGTWRETSRG